MSRNPRDLDRELHFLLVDLARRAGPRSALSDSAFLPAVDVYETDKAAVVVVEVPGVPPESLQVVKEGNVLTISGERQERCASAKLRLVHMEIAYGRFERRILLPEGLGAEGVRAVYQDGLLHVELPKSLRETSGRIRIS